MFEALRSRWALFGAVAIGLYVGAEVSIGSIMINFLNQRQVLGLPLEAAGGYLANFYWGGALCGRLVGTLLLTRIRAARLLAACGIVAALLCAGRCWPAAARSSAMQRWRSAFSTRSCSRRSSPSRWSVGRVAKRDFGPAVRRDLRRRVAADGGRRDRRPFRPQRRIRGAARRLCVHRIVRPGRARARAPGTTSASAAKDRL